MAAHMKRPSSPFKALHLPTALTPSRRWHRNAGAFQISDMRIFFLVLFCWGPMAWAADPVGALRVFTQSVSIANSGAHSTELVCPRKGPAPLKPAAPPAEATEIPDDDEVQDALQGSAAPASAPTPRPPATRLTNARGWRIAIWGDSHMAAAFFSDQLARKLVPADAPVSSRFIQAGVGHAGVRGLVRKTCLSGEWGREMAYAHADAAAAPGPGMTSLVAKRADATLALDLRDAQALPRHTSVQVLYHGDGSGPTQLAVRVDDETETEVTLDKRAGPHALVVQTAYALSSLQIRVLSGSFRFQGIQLPEASAAAAMHMDLFAYPGATVAGWVRSDLSYLASWFTEQPYDLALIAFGTNEGNDPRFSEAAYRDTLTRAVGNFRQVFPQTQCVLIGPGDRGIRVLKSKAAKASKKQAPKGKPKKHAKEHKNAPPAKSPTKSAPTVNLLKFAHIHEQIGQIQADVAAQHGCSAWTMQSAMGGVGSAYPWARKSPPWMAPDLIHFTAAGYRELANTFLIDFGLMAP